MPGIYSGADSLFLFWKYYVNSDININKQIHY